MADNWGADFWGAYADVAKAHAMKQLFEQQQAGKSAFGNAMQDPNIFLPSAPQGGGMPQGAPSGPAPQIQASAGPIFQGLQQRGLDPMHAAVLAGNWKQESEFNPKAWNPKEGAGGMDQWRGPRLQALQQYAAKTGRNWQDPNVQMDFTTQVEGKGSEAGPWGQFIAAKDPAAANAALKNYIRYGDNSQGTRLANAQAILKQFGGGAGGQQPQGGGAPQQGQSPMGGMPGQLSWPHIVQAIMSKNPNLDPKALAEAVDMFQPLMSQQSQMDWREQSLSLREMALQNQQAMNAVRADQGQQRIDQSSQKESDVQSRFDTSTDIRLKGLQQRSDEFKQRMQQAKNKTDRDYYARQAKANADQRHQRIIELIQRGSSTQGAPMSPADQKKAMDDEEARYQQEKASLDAEQSAPPTATAAAKPSAPQSAAQKPQAPAAAAPAPQSANTEGGSGGVPVLGAVDRWAQQHLPGWQGSPMLQGSGGGQGQGLQLKSPDDLKAAVAKGNLPAGSTYNGYTFKGGDPLDQKNWEKGSG